MPGPAPNINRLWADLLIEELVRTGVSTFFVSPGSRSTPLVTALAANSRAQVIVHVDERGSAFAAVGYARATRTPAAWITTSGTAVANGLPAAVEADADGVPLVLLTADRPPELRETASNQTIRQVNLFTEVTRWRFDVPPPDPSVDPAFLLTTVDQAVHRASGSWPGPVHLNLMFREPLAPDEEPGGPVHLPDHLAEWKASSRPWTRYEAAISAQHTVDAGLDPEQNGVVVIARCDPHSARAALDLARQLGWPALADVQSGLRLGAEPVFQQGDIQHVIVQHGVAQRGVVQHGVAQQGVAQPGVAQPGVDQHGIIRHYDAVLGAGIEPGPAECVIQVGRPPVSKRLLQYLERSRPAEWVVCAPGPERIDSLHRVTLRVDSVGSLKRPASAASEGRWLASWMDADYKAQTVLEGLGAGDELSEPAIAAALCADLPGDHGLFLASSMPVRLVDSFATGQPAPRVIAANRGASGIDGNLATAAGMSIGLQSPVTALVGDLATIHDLNALALLKSTPVVLVLINNDGGGIFSLLPISKHPDVFEPYFSAPHGMTFQSAAAQFDLPYYAPESMADFRQVYAHAAESGSSAIIELRTSRDRLWSDHEKLFRQIASVP